MRNVLSVKRATPILLRQTVELMGQHVQLTGQRHLQDEEFLLIDHFRETGVGADPVR